MSDKPKTVAESSYCDLLAMLVPQTPLDFRRAIIMAVMVGRHLEAERLGSPWQMTPPTTPGPWQIACAEMDYEPHAVRVFDQAGELWVDDPAAGSYPLDVYHYNLIDLRWRPVVDADAVGRRAVLDLHIREGHLRAVLQLIASPRRADGTWNRDREACRQLAQEALDSADTFAPRSPAVHASATSPTCGLPINPTQTTSCYECPRTT